MPTSWQLPDDLSVDLQKIVSYLLDANHSEAGPKARFFLTRGFRPAEPLIFVDAIMAHARAYPPKIVPFAYGEKFIVEGPMQTPSGLTTRNVRSVWVRLIADNHARLITAYPF